MSSTLDQVQENIHAQLVRDYGDRYIRDVSNMLYFGLSEEVGEVLGIAKRSIRQFDSDKSVLSREHLVEELGDVLWYLVAVCDVHKMSLEEIWAANKKKLEKRYGQC